MERDYLGRTNYKGFYFIGKVTDTLGTYFNCDTNELFTAPLNALELKDLEYSYSVECVYKLRTYKFQEKITPVIILNGKMEGQLKTYLCSYVAESETGFTQLYARFTDGSSCPFRYIRANTHEGYGDVVNVSFDQVKER